MRVNFRIPTLQATNPMIEKVEKGGPRARLFPVIAVPCEALDASDNRTGAFVRGLDRRKTQNIPFVDRAAVC